MSRFNTTPRWARDAYRSACQNLSLFVLDQAHQAAHDKGFGWVAQPEAPDTYDKLQAAHAISVSTGSPLPVSSLFCDTVIYDKIEVNHAMRFWHDTMHVGSRLTFDLDDELELGLKHLAIAEKSGMSKYSMEYEILRVDLLGQNYLLGIARRFPIDQGEFVRGCLLNGLDEGVLMEARKLPTAA